MSKKVAVKKPQISALYASAKKATVKVARALKVGDVIEAYYIDSETPTRHVVLQRPDAIASVYDVRVLSETAWGSSDRKFGPEFLNTDKWKLIGSAEFPFA